MNDSVQIIEMGTCFIFTCDVPLPLRIKTDLTWVMFGGEGCFGVAFQQHDPRAQRELMLDVVKQVWEQLWNKKTVRYKRMPSPIKGDPRVMLLGKGLGVELTDQSDGYRVWCGDEVLAYMPRPGSRAQYTGRVQQEIASNSPDFGPRR